MTFIESRLAGAWLIEPTVVHDARGLFAVTWNAEEFEQRGLDVRLSQCNLSWNRSRGTLRGMHFQLPPFGQAKVVRCTRGALYDVFVDLRPGSPTFRQWECVELTADNRRLLYVPAGFAHGYQTLADETEAFYQTSTAYAPAHESGLRWNDPAIGVEWPFEPASISDKDLAWPLLSA